MTGSHLVTVAPLVLLLAKDQICMLNYERFAVISL